MPEFGENWFDYKDIYTKILNLTHSSGKIVEVGSWKGKSAAFLAVEIHNSGKNISLDCVDTWLGSDEIAHKNDLWVKNNELYNLFLQNIKSLRHIINPIRMTSIEASSLYEDESIDAVFLDACHEYRCVKEDIFSWFPKVKIGGVLSGHDYSEYWPDVVNAVNDIFQSENIEHGSSCWIYYKTGTIIP
jgi:hypothetical protein